jgi:hypothetical protein
VTTVLEGLVAGDFLAYDDAPTDLADLAVVLGPPAPDEVTDQTDATNDAWIRIATALDDNDEATVLTGPAEAAEDSGVIAALRADDDAAAQVSTADSAESAVGQVAAVLALVAQIGGQNGHYGQVGDVDGPLPVLTGTGDGG